MCVGIASSGEFAAKCAPFQLKFLRVAIKPIENNLISEVGSDFAMPMGMNKGHSMMRGMMAMAGAALLAGCTQLAEGAQRAGDVTKHIVADTKKSWSDVFTYTPKTAAQLPQTRYCYHTMTDVVCYDSVQNTTSHLDGYQDGENISWVQPGGGSLGVSGAEPMAQANAEHVHVAPGVGAMASKNDISVASNSSAVDSVDTSPPPALPTAAPEKSKAGPFYKKESPYAK